jgi:hypothetical protein
MQPGLWELTTGVNRNGALSSRPSRSKCVTTEAVNSMRAGTDFGMGADAQARLSAQFGRDACKIVETRNGQNLMSWRLQCTGKPGAEQEGVARFDNPGHYVLVVRTSMTIMNKTLTSVMTTEGQHKGQCP